MLAPGYPVPVHYPLPIVVQPIPFESPIIHVTHTHQVSAPAVSFTYPIAPDVPVARPCSRRHSSSEQHHQPRDFPSSQRRRSAPKQAYHGTDIDRKVQQPARRNTSDTSPPTLPKPKGSRSSPGPHQDSQSRNLSEHHHRKRHGSTNHSPALEPSNGRHGRDNLRPSISQSRSHSQEHLSPKSRTRSHSFQ